MKGSDKMKDKVKVHTSLGMIQEEIMFDNKLRDKVSKKDTVILKKEKESAILIVARVIQYFVIFVFVFGCPIF